MKTLTKKLKPLAFSVMAAASLLTTVSEAASISAQQTVYSAQGGMITPKLIFNQVESGDLYLAVSIDGQLYFILSDGSLSSTAQPFLSNQDFSGTLDLPQFDTTGIPSGQYPLYQVITHPGTDVFNFTNWVGGIGALNVINFSVGLPTSITKDFDNDGWSDDDLNYDGYHDDDHNKDGYHDDDLDKDGYHDDDLDHDGYHDNENDSEDDSNDDENESNNSSLNTSKHDDEHEEDEHEEDEHEEDEHEEDEHEEDEHEEDEHEEDEHEEDEHEENEYTNGSSTVSTSNSTTNNGSASSTTNSTSVNNTTTSSAQSIARGKASYVSHCASCHGANPLNNGNGILSARSASASRNAITRNIGGMGFLTNTDSELQDIANYINSL